MSYSAKLIPPDSQYDRNVLGAGSSKFAWRSPYIKGAIINSFDQQRRAQKPEGMTMYQWDVEYDKNMRTEYEFTKYVRTIFGELIPWVKSIPSDRFNDKKFRYEKELCDKVNMYTDEMRVKFFHEMFALQDIVLSKGWVFMDMKPDNVGVRKDTRTLCLVDTDPCHFYRVRPNMIEHFRVASYMVILLISIRNQIPTGTLIDKMKEKGLTKEKMDNTYQYFQKLRKVDMENIAYYGNMQWRNEYFKIKDVVNPVLFINSYGSGQVLSILLSIALNMNKPIQTSSVNLNSPEHSVNLDQTNSPVRSLNLNAAISSAHASDHSSAKVSQSSLAYSMNSLMNHLDEAGNVFYPRTPRKRQTKRRNTRIHARNVVRKPTVNTIRERVLERKRLTELANKQKSPAKRKTAKGIKI